MSYEDNYDQTARWDAESVREAEQRTQHRSTRSSAERQKLKKKGQRRRFTLWLAFVLITSAILAGVGWLLANDMCSFNKAPVETTIEITRDDNLNTIATKLHDEGLIKYKWFFKAFGRLRHAESRIGIGTYAVDSDMDYDALINRMSNKNASLTANTVKISIPEGYNVRQIIALMDKYGVNTAEKLTDAAMNSDFNYSFIDNNKKGDLTRLEGYLFPDTYEFFVDEDPTHALSRLLDNFNTKMSDELMQKVEASGYSLNQILTIASLIEKETDGTDRENIASVIYNRLNNIGETYHKLQIDASLIYGLGDNYTGTLTSSDLNYNTPYNLSMYEGLPPTPIANPGLASIQAALEPAQTNYYFYALGKDGELHAGGASQSGAVRARPRCARPRDGEYDAAQRRGRAPARALGAFERRRCRRAYFGRPRRVYARGEVCAQVRAPYLDPAVDRKLRVRPRVVRFGRETSGAGKGSVFTGNSRNARENSRGAGGRDLLSWRDVRELFGPLPSLKLYDRPRLEPRPVRPALPLPVCADGGETSGRIFPRL